MAEPRVQLALERIKHRGPNGRGMHFAPQAVLGMCRLAVIDLTGGDQPIYNEDRSLAVVCNGEIYNYPELFEALASRGHVLQSGSDINVIPHLYEEEGAAAVRHWRGMFAAALWDESRQQLTLFRDRLGKKPLFYSRLGEGLAFASELPALLALLEAVPDFDTGAMYEYLQLGFVPHPHTIYRGIHVLPPACTLTFSRGAEVRVSAYWDRSFPPAFRGSRVEALEQLSQRLKEAVTIRLRSDVPMGLFLSGGIDSGLVASYAAECGARDLRCFVVETGDPSLNEVDLAVQSARACGLDHRVIPLRFAPSDVVMKIATLYGQPFADSSAVPSYLVSEAAARERRVVLNGDGGDEVFAGYRRHVLSRLLPAWRLPGCGLLARMLGNSRNRRSASGFVTRMIRGLGQDQAERYLTWSVDLLDAPALRRLFPDLSHAKPTEQAVLRRCDTLREFLWTDTRLILADDLLSKMDIATMAHGLEARSPFLDVPLMEFTWSLPEQWLLAGRTTKPLLRSLAERRLPQAVVRAPKKGFEVPVARWLQEDLRPLVHDTLLGADSRVGRMADMPALRAFVSGKDGFMGNRAQAIWMLLMLELFLRAPTPAAAGHD